MSLICRIMTTGRQHADIDEGVCPGDTAEYRTELWGAKVFTRVLVGKIHHVECIGIILVSRRRASAYSSCP